MAEDKNIQQDSASEIRDSDPTSELEELTWRRDEIVVKHAQLEVEASTAELEKNAESGDSSPTGPAPSHSYQLEQQAALIRGLQAESATRQDIIDDLNRRIDELARETESLRRSKKKASAKASHARAEIRERGSELRELRQQLKSFERDTAQLSEKNAALKAELSESEEQLLDREQTIESLREDLSGSKDRQADKGPTPSDRIHQYEIRSLNGRLVQLESLSDDLRRSLQDRMAADEATSTKLQLLESDLEASSARNTALTEQLDEAASRVEELESDVLLVAGKHSEEIREARSGADAAREEAAQQKLINDQLTADLINTRSFKKDLEDMMTSMEQKSRQRIDELEEQLDESRKTNARLEKQLDEKNNAVNCLLAELGSRQGEPAENLESAAASEDAGVEELNNPGLQNSSKWRRYLIGNVDGQEVQFPLFKGRVTIGRTQDNDIQLTASYISRRHAVIVTDGDVARLVDWGSRNGVEVNGEPVTEHFLRSGDRVRIGTFTFVFEEKPRTDA